jgi:hypothetical protein
MSESSSTSLYPADINAMAIRNKLKQAARDKVVADIREALDKNAVSVIFTIDKRVQLTISAEIVQEFPELASRKKNTDDFVLVPHKGVHDATEFRIVF